MSDLTPERLDQIELAAKKASSVYGRGWHTRVSLERDTHSRIPAWHSDAEHIANMDPATTLALIHRVKELEAQVTSAKFLEGTWGRDADELKDNGRFSEWAIFEVHRRELRRALGVSS